MRKPLAIYVHVPFCVKKCNYCDFLSGPADQKSKKEYIRSLLCEIRSYKELAKEYIVHSVFIGGGTPSSVDAEYIDEIMRTLREIFVFTGCDDKNTPEITIEINPGIITEEKLQTYFDAGINRISFGLQSTNDNELKMLGRIHTYEQFLDNYRLARKVGFQNINIDLMSALPGQTVESYQNTLERIIALQPEHISAYSLIIEEGTPFYDIYGEDREGESDHEGGLEKKSKSCDQIELVNKIESHNEVEQEEKMEPCMKLPSEDDERLMYDNTRIILHQHGYERYEISNYAKPGFECKHNCTYWQRGDYLGIGSGAASLIQNHRFNNVSDLQTYITFAGQQEKADRQDEANRQDRDNKYIEDVSERSILQDDLAGMEARCKKAEAFKLNIDIYHKNLHQEYEELSLDSQMEEFMFLGLRLMRGVSISEFKKCFQRDIFEIYGDVIRTLVDEELLVQDNDRIYLTLRGIDISNYVMSEFMLEV